MERASVIVRDYCSLRVVERCTNRTLLAVDFCYVDELLEFQKGREQFVPQVMKVDVVHNRRDRLRGDGLHSESRSPRWSYILVLVIIVDTAAVPWTYHPPCSPRGYFVNQTAEAYCP